MSAHILLNLLKELEKGVKMWGLLRILSLFRNKFNKLNIKYRSTIIIFYLSSDIKLI